MMPFVLGISCLIFSVATRVLLTASTSLAATLAGLMVFQMLFAIAWIPWVGGVPFEGIAQSLNQGTPAHGEGENIEIATAILAVLRKVHGENDDGSTLPAALKKVADELDQTIAAAVMPQRGASSFSVQSASADGGLATHGDLW